MTRRDTRQRHATTTSAPRGRCVSCVVPSRVIPRLISGVRDLGADVCHVSRHLVSRRVISGVRDLGADVLGRADERVRQRAVGHALRKAKVDELEVARVVEEQVLGLLEGVM